MVVVKKMNELGEAWADICTKCWEDAKFKEKVMADPGKVLKEHGIELPELFNKVAVHDYGNDGNLHINLFSPPPVLLVSEEQLEQVYAAGCGCGG